MNELIEKLIGKRCELSGDNISFGVVGVITAVCDGWVELTDDKGTRRLYNIAYIAGIRERPAKVK